MSYPLHENKFVHKNSEKLEKYPPLKYCKDGCLYHYNGSKLVVT